MEWLFFIPFILVGVFSLMLTVYLLFVRVKLILNPGHAELFRGIGSCGRRRKFRLAKNARISIEESNLYHTRRVVRKIVVEQPEGRPFSFGTDFSDEEVRQSVAALLRQMRE